MVAAKTELHVVTGASSGVGRALCLHLASLGLPVLALARRREELEKLMAECPEEISIMDVDLRSPGDRDAVRAAIEGQFQVKSLVHSAAVSSRGYLRDLDYQTYRDVMAINLEAPLFLTQALLPHMVSRARVLHLSSGSAYRSMEYHGLYSISKAALVMLYQAWNADFPGGEVLVGSAMPGVVEGPMQDAAREGDHPGAEVFVAYKESGKLIQPARVAQFLAWLLFKTSAEDFTSKDWNIFDDSHHSKWLQGTLSG